MRKFIWCLFALLVFLALPSKASAQCSFANMQVTYHVSRVNEANGAATDVVASIGGANPGCWPDGHFRTEVWYEGVPNNSTYCYKQIGLWDLKDNNTCINESLNITQASWETAVLYRYGCSWADWKQWLITPGGWTILGAGRGQACGPNPPLQPADYPSYCYYWSDWDQTWRIDYGNGDCISPILLPIGKNKTDKRDSFKLTDVQHGVTFDLNADGVPDTVSWTASGSHLAFLALDRNGNGKIDNGSELYGNHTYAEVSNGFQALSNDLVAQGDALYSKLLLWEDENHDGISQPEELHKLLDSYKSIDGSYVGDDLRDKYNNLFQFSGSATTLDGTVIKIYDVFFRTN